MTNADLGQATPAERSLVESEAMYRNAFEFASVGIAHVGPDGRWINVNRRVAEIVGYTREELWQITFQDITHPEDLDLDMGLLQEVLAGERDSYRIEKRYFHKKGHIVWVTLSVSCIRLESGEVDYFISVLQDITEKRRIRTALTQSENRFKAVQETSPDGFMILRSLRTLNGDIEDFVWDFINPAAEQLTGRVHQGLIGKRLKVEMPEIFNAGLFEIVCGIVETGQPWKKEVYYETREGLRWYAFTLARIGDGFAASFQDVTDRKLAEQKLQESQTRLRTILDGVMSLIGLATPSGRLVEINEPSLKLAKSDNRKHIGEPVWEHPVWSHTPATQDRLMAAFNKARTGERVRFDAEVHTADGQLMPVDVQLAPLMDEDGAVTDIVLSAVDISERKRAEAHREMLLNELNHRVKNSLATMQAIASHTLREATSIDGFRTSFAGRVRAIAASHDLLVSTNREAADISELIHDQVGAYAPEEACRLSLSGPPVVLGPQGAHAFGLILHELATNASKYGAFSNDCGRIEINWHVESGPDDQIIVLSWTESGGPTVLPPSRKGFGSVLIEQSLSHALGGGAELDFDPDGLRAVFRFSATK